MSQAPKLFDQDRWLFSSCFLELNIVQFSSIKEALIECFLWQGTTPHNKVVVVDLVGRSCPSRVHMTDCRVGQLHTLR